MMTVKAKLVCVSVTSSFNWAGGTAVAVSTQKQIAAVEGWGHSGSVSFLGCVMSALLLKIAQHTTTGGSFRVKQDMLDESGSMWCGGVSYLEING